MLPETNRAPDESEDKIQTNFIEGNKNYRIKSKPEANAVIALLP